MEIESDRQMDGGWLAGRLAGWVGCVGGWVGWAGGSGQVVGGCRCEWIDRWVSR